MLAGKQFGWGHEGYLRPGREHMQGTYPGNQGLSASYISLEQPVHGLLAVQVPADFLENGHLVYGQGKRKLFDEFQFQFRGSGWALGRFPCHGNISSPGYKL